jgi:hypothetical protein
MPALLEASIAAEPSAVANKLWLSVEELEALSGISRWTWRRWAQRGTIASAKVSTRLLVSRLEFDRVMAEASRPRANSTLKPSAPQSSKRKSARGSVAR